MSIIIPKRPLDGFIPGDFLLNLARLNPGNLSILETLTLTQQLALQASTGGLYATRTMLSGTGTGERKIYDAEHRQTLPGVRARFEEDSAVSDEVVNRAWEYHGIVREFLKEVAERNSLDNRGMPLVGSVHVGRRYNNAFYDGRGLAYGDGDGILFNDFVKLDIVAHEMGHGVTDYTSDLVYYGESGALNESLSDVIGVLARQYHGKITAQKDSWLVGENLFAEGIKARALRDMLNPGTAYDDPRVGKDSQPAHTSKQYQGTGDNGGVHINSGIPNRAFALFARESCRYAWKKPFSIWYATNCGENRVKKDASFVDFAAKTVENCRMLGYDNLVDKLVGAWNAVGVDCQS